MLCAQYSIPDLADKDLVVQFLAADKELGLLKMLGGLNAADRAVSENRNMILIFSGESGLEVKTFRDAPDALRALFELERQMPDRDIVLVRADSSDEVRLAFKNYFSDAQDFIHLVEEGCTKLNNTTMYELNQIRSLAQSVSDFMARSSEK